MSEAMQPATAIFAGGCFWCTEAAFEQLAGVLDVTSGYIGGSAETANYAASAMATPAMPKRFASLTTPAKISFEQLLAVFFDAHDPTQLNRQGNDIGTQYRSAIFYADENEQQVAEAKIRELNAAKPLPGRSPPRSSRSRPSIPPRTTTRTTPGRIPASRTFRRSRYRRSARSGTSTAGCCGSSPLAGSTAARPAADKRNMKTRLFFVSRDASRRACAYYPNWAAAQHFSFSVGHGHGHHHHGWHHPHHCWDDPFWCGPHFDYVYVAPPPVCVAKFATCSRSSRSSKRVSSAAREHHTYSRRRRATCKSGTLAAGVCRLASWPTDSRFPLSDGQSHTFYGGGPRTIEFDRGGDFGTARVELTGGQYEFLVTSRGWDLVRAATRRQRLAKRPRRHAMPCPAAARRAKLSDSLCRSDKRPGPPARTGSRCASGSRRRRARGRRT